MSRGAGTNGFGGRLLRSLVADAALRGVTLTLIDAAERPWASATFVGSRHTLRVALAGADATAWLAALPEADLPIPGCLVADVAVDRSGGDAALLTVLLIDPA